MGGWKNTVIDRISLTQQLPFKVFIPKKVIRDMYKDLGTRLFITLLFIILKN